MTTTLKVVVNYEPFGLEESFEDTCFGHAFSKACQYCTAKEKVCKELKYVFIKSVQANLQKCIIWPKKSRKGRQNGTRLVLRLALTLDN
jgi:hypothetical protein